MSAGGSAPPEIVDFSPSEPLSILQLSLFRTELCRLKAATAYCAEGERCPFSHCLSWHRRNPFVFAYRPLLCPNTRFWTEAKRMKVKTWCRRGRHCLFAHTKEEQMYHPLVYKTQICRDWPGCRKPFCPFAHGLGELRDPDSFPVGSFEGPETVDGSVRHLVGEDKIRQEFERRAKEKESLRRSLTYLQRGIRDTRGVNALSLVIFQPRMQRQLYTGQLMGLTPSFELFDELFQTEVRYGKYGEDQLRAELLPDGLIAIPIQLVADSRPTSQRSAESGKEEDECSTLEMSSPVESGDTQRLAELDRGLSSFLSGWE